MNPRGLRGLRAQCEAGAGDLGPLEDAPRFAEPSRARKPSRQGEGALSDAIREALAYEPGLTLWRNSQAVMRKGSRVYRGGLGNGSADLVGVLHVQAFAKIEDRGFAPRFLGRFVALEVKRPGEIPTDERIARLRAPGALRNFPGGAHDLAQWQWLESVRRVGGFACYVDSVDSARAAIARARRGEAS